MNSERIRLLKSDKSITYKRFVIAKSLTPAPVGIEEDQLASIDAGRNDIQTIDTSLTPLIPLELLTKINDDTSSVMRRNGTNSDKNRTDINGKVMRNEYPVLARYPKEFSQNMTKNINIKGYDDNWSGLDNVRIDTLGDIMHNKLEDLLDLVELKLQQNQKEGSDTDCEVFYKFRSRVCSKTCIY